MDFITFHSFVGICVFAVLHLVVYYRLRNFVLAMYELHSSFAHTNIQLRNSTGVARRLLREVGVLLSASRHAPDLLKHDFFSEIGFGPEPQASEEIEPGREALFDIPLQPMSRPERSPELSPKTEPLAVYVNAVAQNDASDSPFGLLR